MAQEFSPTEIFKRATATTLRAIAEDEEVNVTFGPEPAGLSGRRVKLPGLRSGGRRCGKAGPAVGGRGF